MKRLKDDDSTQGRGGLRMDMTHGPMTGKIIGFALPLIAAGMLQQSFNTVDVAVVGHWVGTDALAAVGSNGQVISLIVNLFAGLSVGSNVVISHYIGRRDDEGIRRAVSTTAVVALLSGLLLMAIGLSAARPILESIDTPESIIGPAGDYLRIFFLGMPSLMAFNFGGAVLRSLGDTRTPFYALMAGGIVNAVIDLWLVAGCGLGVEAVAAATVVGLTLSAAIVVWSLMRRPAPYTLMFRRLRARTVQLRKILAIGLPAGLQGVVFSLSNVFILGNINRFGALAATGSAAAINFEYYCYFIIAAFAQATVAFTSANYGAGEEERCRRVFRTCMVLSLVVCGAANAAIVLLRSQAVGLFTTDAGVMHYAFGRMTVVLLFQFLASSYEISGAALRGMGYSMTPTVLTILGTCVIRIGWVHTVTADATDWTMLMLVYPLTWSITGAAVITAYLLIRPRAFAHLSRPQ